MIISEDLLLAYGANYESFEANQTIFHEGNLPKFYYQIINGIVELNNYHEDGKEFIQNILHGGESFGESFLFDEKTYPTNATAKTSCTVLKLSKADFFNLLDQNPEVSSKMFKCLAEWLYYKYVMLFNVSSPDPLNKLKTVMDYLKGNDNNKYSFQIPLTRQQLANLTGLRVETVIRTIKKMHNAHLIKVQNRKIFY
ncbi:cAMP-binding domain of CRP or a regulatory subunit of cAMP-dependent protein kinases [Chryseobacterium rhizoplanae]|uniref:cAMP-binding domain of CRP or a regulatory subunit of cAMP-dependent protein kinases n=1 Tax=Chryseobacterium rhizoplanae TaxID=1609531 RepID=A0A521B8P6_9FLAO|nr:Crp/Fnr family transcriptional regulator [Chryseobacterium rhizoplanae]SMO43381.1 cAMP-binding domain of CRP or a regulatory subunit of cAMP-dependent protein kinases [Chryseobacterium rhizoplanae]